MTARGRSERADWPRPQAPARYRPRREQLNRLDLEWRPSRRAMPTLGEEIPVSWPRRG